MGSRSEGRAAALKVLYGLDTRAAFDDVEGELGRLRADLLAEYSEEAMAFGAEICRSVTDHRQAIDAAIEGASHKWRIDRMSRVDRNILRIGALELLFCPEIPARVAINEALELAKLFGANESRQFINGVLDRMRRDHEPQS